MAYVYRHIRLDKNVPFYIGIGKSIDRASDKFSRNPIWNNIAKKTAYEVELLFEDVSFYFACAKEKELVKLYGRIDLKTGTLANMTGGGEGGTEFSDETKRKIGDATKRRPGYWKGKKQPPEAVIKSSETRRGKPMYKRRGIPASDRVKNAVSLHATGNKYCVGRIMSKETRDKISKANTGRIVKDTWKYSMPGEKNGMWGKKHTKESIQKNRDAQKKKAVIQINSSGDVINEYSSISEAARITGLFATGISGSCRKKYGFLKYKGFVWEYKIKNATKNGSI